MKFVPIHKYRFLSQASFEDISDVLSTKLSEHGSDRDGIQLQGVFTKEKVSIVVLDQVVKSGKLMLYPKINGQIQINNSETQLFLYTGLGQLNIAMLALLGSFTVLTVLAWLFGGASLHSIYVFLATTVLYYAVSLIEFWSKESESIDVFCACLSPLLLTRQSI